jgi:hypothetical protein
MVHIGEISFCDKTAYNIKSDEIKKQIMEVIESKYNLRIITKHFDKFDPKYMHNINSNPHLICVRSNGNPYFLYLTKIDFVNYCIFIDKKIQQGYFYPRMIVTHFHFNDELFEDTVFDGEMIKKTGEKWVFMINDLIVSKGNYLSSLNLVKRLNLLYTILKNDYQSDDVDVCTLQVKKYFKYDQIETLFKNHIPSLKYSCRGIYFKPLFLRFRDILVNFDDALITKVQRTKYKHVKNFLLIEDTMDTVDPKDTQKIFSTRQKFYVRKTSNPDVYDLFKQDNTFVDIACVPTLKLSKYMRSIFAEKNIVDKVEMSFEFSDKFKKWVPFIE